jgi:hypothetical protein
VRVGSRRGTQELACFVVLAIFSGPSAPGTTWAWEKKIDCGAAMFKSVETRFASQVSMTERVLQQKKVFKALAKDALFLE